MLRLNYLLVPVFWNSSREIIPNKLSHSKVNDAYEFIVHLKESTCTCGVVDWVDSFWLARGLIFLLTSFPYLLGSISNPDSPAIAWKLLQINATKQKKSQRSQAQKYQSFSVLYEALKYQNVRSGKHGSEVHVWPHEMSWTPNACVYGRPRGGGEHSATPGTFFVFVSSNKKWRHIR